MLEEGERMVSVSEETLFLLYWTKFPEWYTKEKIDGETVFKLKPDAPEQIKKSFDAWDKQKDD